MKNIITLVALAVFLLTACGESGDAQLENKASDKSESSVSKENISDGGDIGVGPIKNVTIGDLDQAMAKEGEEIFTKNCSACHKIDSKFVGPALAGVTERRKPEWIMNMILNPENMVKEDPVARELLAEYMAPMANQNMTEDQARNILEYFRQVDSK